MDYSGLASCRHTPAQLLPLMFTGLVFLRAPAAGGPDPGRHGDLGERGRELLPAAAGAVLQPGHAVRQRGLLQHRHRDRAGAAGAPGLLRGPQGEQVSAAHGKFIRTSVQMWRCRQGLLRYTFFDKPGGPIWMLTSKPAWGF